MKKTILALFALLSFSIGMSGMSYRQAREQALFLTDKMAYELNLTDAQYEAAYEINLDYLMSIDSYHNLYGIYWRQRNIDLSYILLDWQYRMYMDAAYFYRPLYWDNNYWHFRIYARYPHRDYYFFGQPTFYITYNGGHSRHYNGGRSWYNGRRYVSSDNRNRHFGMRDGFERGEFGRGTRLSSQSNGNFGNGRRNLNSGGSSNGRRSFGGARRESSTRTTVTRPETRGSFGARSSETNTPRRTFSPNNDRRSSRFSERARESSSSTRSFGSRPSSSGHSFGSSSGSSGASRSFGNSSRSSGMSRSSGAPARRSGSFGSGSRSNNSSSGGHFGRR